MPSGQQRVADLVAQMQTLNGEPRLILVHTEVQARKQDAFPARMWEYNALLRLRKGQPTISVALVLHTGTAGLSLERYTERLFGRDYTLLEYWQVGLRDLRVVDYLEAEQPLALGLAALMDAGGQEPSALRTALLDRLQRTNADPGRVSLLVNMIETFLPPAPGQEVAAERRPQGEGAGVMATDINWEGPTWADRVMMQGQRKTLLRQLRLRFGEVPETLVAQVQAADEATLDAMLDRVVTASSIEEFQHASSR